MSSARIWSRATRLERLDNSWFSTANSKGTGSARLFCASAVQGSVTDQFFGIPRDDENKRGGQNPPNWHVSISTAGKLVATRFLTVIEVIPGKKLGDQRVKPEPEGTGRMPLRLGDYAVTAELDASEPSYLEVHDRTGTCALVTGQASRSITLGKDQRTAQFAGSTLLWEKGSGQVELFREEVDRLPDVLIYGNRY